MVADSLDTTGPGCNVALTQALTTIEMMVEMEDTWQDLSNKFKLCSTLDGFNTMDVRSFMELLIDNLAGIVQYNGRLVFSNDLNWLENISSDMRRTSSLSAPS